MVREIRVGNVSGKSSYELAVAAGTFTGTLAEYLAKEQKAYDDMVTYGTNLKQEIDAKVRPRFEFAGAVSSELYVNDATDTEVYYKQIGYNVYGTLSAFVILSAETPVNDGIMTVLVNDQVVFASSIVNNVASLNVNLELNRNDEIKVMILQNSGVNRAIANSGFNLLTFERS